MEQNLQMETEIRNAIRDDRVMIFLQPIYSNTKKQFVSAEVLARIKKEDGSILMPSVFVPIAEETGIICELEEVIVRKVCEFVRDYDIRSMGLDYVEVNLSVKNGERADFAEKCKSLISEYKVDPKLINFEITETATLSKRGILLKNINCLMEYGFQFSLDDFGSGQCNLNYIVDMPVTIIKFDKNFADTYKHNEKTKMVMESMVRMAHDLGIKTVSEGIETEEMFFEMNDIGIDYVQGYYLSKPLPVETFVNFVTKSNEQLCLTL